MSTPLNQKIQSSFEFTKRKKYADLLIAELAEAIILVLSLECRVLFCGAGVTELLGWRDEDLVDGDLIELINEEDRSNFRTSFDESVRTRNELLCYVRLKRKSHFSAAADHDPNPREVLFELKGHPHFITDQDGFKCFFAVAKPYPSRNTAMLNAFLELKMENERLQQRLSELRKRAPQLPSTSSSSTIASSYGPTSMQTSRPYPAPIIIPNRAPGEMAQPYYPTSATSVGGYSSMMPGSVNRDFDGSNVTPYAHAFNPVMDEDLSEDGTRKKKLKKSHADEQYVCFTCGRTDSPEWRKGPHGPKTLCNACGLRWAKQQRKADDGNDATGNGDSHTQARASSSAVAT
ncbi:hypothetical protein PILCRDRAFT_823114 [Piloderma croceum F 1598]|uniref:GATA-type domain-containing protein n=1 Tax=Piloderma croceum (strain F 1598) TaxID=765440 RepID=A0A0C3B019_PILCF|nr:hypothetical protein PILCRDRAFT_823114 [Piloderma croceum F 1598]